MSNATTTDRASVYVLMRRDRRRFKLGWARRPLHRARRLPEFRRGELDLEHSRAIWLPSRQRAEQVERSMHKSLAPYRVPAGHHGDGAEEWFAGTAQDTALRMLAQMPLQESSNATARLLPLTVPAPPSDAVSIETGPQDTWWRIEDVLSRLALRWPVSVCAEPVAVVVHGFRIRDPCDPDDLRRAALDADTYQCWCDGRRLAFVQTLNWEGDDLVVRMTPATVIAGWEGGHEIAWQVTGFLARLRRRSPIRPTH